jgi:hypothetical protein
MPAAYRDGDKSTGADGGAATAVSASTSKSYINGQLAAVLGDQHASHVIPGPVVHSGSQRAISGAASKTYWEGTKAARTDDPIADGDICGAGSPNTFIE